MHSARCLIVCAMPLVQAAWKNAIEKARAMPDPWAEFHLEEVQTEPCIRYRSVYVDQNNSPLPFPVSVNPLS